VVLGGILVNCPTPARRSRTLVVLLVALALAVAGVNGAAAAPVGLVVTDDAPVFWTGTADTAGRTYAEVPACQETGCDRIRIRIALPDELEARPGGVQVAIRWSDATTSLGLYAVRDDVVVASSTGQIGTAQSLLLPKVNGSYLVYISSQPFDPAAAPAQVDYEGLAENEDDPPVEPVRHLLPDLRILPQRGVTFDSPPPFFDDTAAAEGSSCFSSEVLEQGARTCLRFGQAAENAGSGPLDLRYSVDPDDPSADAPAVQLVHLSDRTVQPHQAGWMDYHASHQHFHFEAFSQSWLYRLDDTGRPDSAPAATGRKNGFCMADTEMARWGQKGDAPQTFPAPRCLFPIGQEDGRDLYKNGISVGWADEYTWNLPDQMIEVSGLTDGRYRLVTRVDADDRLLEADETNNCVALDLELSSLSGTPQVREISGPMRCE
jgi:hypothetical protein